MKYIFSDFILLQNIPSKSIATAGAVYEGLCESLLLPLPAQAFLCSLKCLAAGGYITVEPTDGVLSAKSPVSLTEKGKKAITPPWLGKLLNESKATAKALRAFCEIECPLECADGGPGMETEGFDEILRGLYEKHSVMPPMFEVTDAGEGYAKLTVHHPSDDGEAEAEGIDDPDAAALCYSASVTGTEQQIQAGLRDLIDTAYLFVTEPPRPRKVALHGTDGTLLVSMAQAAGEQEGCVLFRVTVSRIRFNRQRFIGKRDGDLDYAQCGDPIFTHETSDAYSFCGYGILFSAALYRHLLSGEDLEKISFIYRKIYK